MKEQSIRARRMGSLIQGELSRMLIEEIQDPRLQRCSITEVVLTGDLKQARIFIAAEGAPKEVLQGLKRACPFFRRTLSRGLDVKYVPDLVFELDNRTEDIYRLMQTMGSLKDSPNHTGLQ